MQPLMGSFQVLIAGALLALATAATAAPNPFAQPSPLPFEAPPFDKISDADYQSAIEEGIAASLAEIRGIADNPAPPAFDNTIVALERQGQALARAQLAFGQVTQANTNPTLQKAQAALAPKLAAYNDAVYLDPKLFARVKALHERRASLKLDDEQSMLLEDDYRRFVRAGAQLSPADQATLRDLNGRIASLGIDFRQKLLAATKSGALVIDDPARLAGLGKAEIDSAARDAKDRGLDGKYVLALQNTTSQPAIQSLTDRPAREILFDHSWTRAEKGDANDTRDTIAQLAQLRSQKASLLGYKTWADYSLEEQMAKNAQTAEGFMKALDAPTAAAQAREAGEIQAAIDADHGGFALQPWDWEIYAEKVRKAKLDLDENETKPYLEIWNVLENGVFYAAGQMYGLTFERRTDIPTYHPDIRVYEVFDADRKPLGLAYFDYWKRDNKAGGAWMNNIVNQSKLLGTKPVIYNVANFTKPAPGQPALISFDDVTTMFHEFGHALHGLFANEEYPALSGTNVARDFVEFPSQFNEHWALYPQVFQHFAVHYKTGKPMPQALVDKIQKAAKFNQGYELGELVAAAELDMQWHTLPASAPKQDVDKFEVQALKNVHLDMADVPPRYRSSYFNHIWASGYAAGYYAYSWTEMLDDDAYHWFIAHGGLTRANGQRFRDMILSRGHTEDYGPMFRAFYGKDPEIGPMLEHRGLPAQ